MRVALIYPPSCDPTAPYLSIPNLTAWLRAKGIEVIPIDANLEAWESLLCESHLQSLHARLENRLAELDSSRTLSHQEQLEYLALWNVRAEAAAVASTISDAISVLRDETAFYDKHRYASAIATIEAAQRVVSACYSPLSVDFVSYRTPFSLTHPDEIQGDSTQSRNPFFEYFSRLADRIQQLNVDLVGISVVFPGQVQPSYSLALILRSILKGVHVTAGGPALTQIVVRQKSEAEALQACFAFDSVVVGEGEIALVELLQTLARNEQPAKIINGTRLEDLSCLPAPDFDGLPLDRYFSPKLVLPYDPSRGCYWGVCAFCHYGLAKTGTARHRQRSASSVADHLASLSARYQTDTFYLSQDVLSPGLAKKLASELVSRGLALKWGSDIRPERALSKSWCEDIAKGGALCVSVGVESASERVLSLINKGVHVEDVRRAISHLAQAGIAVEAMCFSDFPTESGKEALDTIRFIEEMRSHLSLFILGKFDLTAGALVAQQPARFGVAETWTAKGDTLANVLFYREGIPAKREKDYARIESALSRVSSTFLLRHYPWAGALSTAHTMLWYARFGRGIFRKLAASDLSEELHGPTREKSARFNLEQVAESACAFEEKIWSELHQRREVSRAAYEQLASRARPARPSPVRVRYGLDNGIEVLPK